MHCARYLDAYRVIVLARRLSQLEAVEYSESEPWERTPSSVSGNCTPFVGKYRMNWREVALHHNTKGSRVRLHLVIAPRLAFTVHVLLVTAKDLTRPQ